MGNVNYGNISINKWDWQSTQTMITEMNNEKYQFGIHSDILSQIIGLNIEDTEKFIQLFFSNQNMNLPINNITILIAIIMTADPVNTSVETKKRTLFSLVDYNNKRNISLDELEVLLYCVGLCSACLLNRKKQKPSMSRIRELLQRAKNTLNKQSRTSTITEEEFIEWSREIGDEESTMMDIFHYFVPEVEMEIVKESNEKKIKQEIEPEQTIEPIIKPESIIESVADPQHEERIIEPFIEVEPVITDISELFASDAQSYPLLIEKYQLMLENYHGVNLSSTNTLFISNRDSSELERMETIDYSYVISTRIQSSRNIRGYSFSPSISSSDRLQLESLIINSFDGMKGEFFGYYYNLSTIATNDYDYFQTNQLLLTPSSSSSSSSSSSRLDESINRDWPEGRGIFNNNSTEFAVWINGIDHLTIISQNNGGDISSVFEDWITAINGIERCLFSSKLMFEQNNQLGYLTTSLSNMGSGFHAIMTIKLPNLSQNILQLQLKCKELNLLIKKCNNNNNENKQNWEVSTKYTLGKSEVEIIQQLIDGICELIKEEKKLM